MSTQYLGVTHDGSARVVFSHNVAWFSGLTAPGYATVREQTAAILSKYDKLFEIYHLKKKNLMYIQCFLKNADYEKDFTDLYYAWLDPDGPAAGFTVTGVPEQNQPEGNNVLVCLQVLVALNDNLEIKHYDITNGCRMVMYDGMAYFTGHGNATFKTLAEQTSGVLNRYQELFDRFGLKRENVVALYGFVKDAADIEEARKPIADFFGKNLPAVTMVQARPNQTTSFGSNLQLELVLFVAAEDQPSITRHEIAPGKSIVEYNGMAWFPELSAQGRDIAEQAQAILSQYDNLFNQYGYKKENLVMSYGFLRNIEAMPAYLPVVNSWYPDCTPASVIVEVVPSEPTTQLNMQLIVSIDG